MMVRLINRVLETMWNKTTLLQAPANYFIFSKGRNKVVVKDIEVKGKAEKVIFVSKQLVYSRTGKMLKKVARLYRVEVIMTSEDSTHSRPSEIFMVPELCWSVFKNTLVPHSCAINFVIAMLKLKK